MSVGGRGVDVCVVGAGIMGLSAAYELATRGQRVVCVEEGAPGRKATGSTAGTLAIQNKRLGSIPITLHSIEMWRELSERLGHDLGYEVLGGVRVADDEPTRQALEKSAAKQAELGAPVEMVYPPELFDLAPYLSRQIVAASYCREDGMGDPFATVRGYLRACRRTGRVDFRIGARVTHIEARSVESFVVWLDEGRIECGAVLVAAGAGIPRLLEPLGIDLPLSTQIQQVLITDSCPPLFPHVVTHASGNLTVKQQKMSGKVLVGGAWPGDGNLDEGEHRLRRSSVLGNARKAVRTVPALAGARLLRGWTGIEGRSPDGLPLLGPIDGASGLHILGCAAGGFTLAPACGQIAADLLLGQEPAIPHRAYLVSRFLKGDDGLRPRTTITTANERTRRDA